MKMKRKEEGIRGMKGKLLDMSSCFEKSEESIRNRIEMLLEPGNCCMIFVVVVGRIEKGKPRREGLD